MIGQGFIYTLLLKDFPFTNTMILDQLWFIHVFRSLFVACLRRVGLSKTHLHGSSKEKHDVLPNSLTRLVPHPPNFAPITAMSLFAGAYFTRKQLAFIVPLLAMLISDLFLGFYKISIFVYLSFAVITWMGQQQNKVTPKSFYLGVFCFSSSVTSGFGCCITPKLSTGLSPVLR